MLRGIFSETEENHESMSMKLVGQSDDTRSAFVRLSEQTSDNCVFAREGEDRTDFNMELLISCI